MIIYTTKDGDVLDWIVWKHYKTISALEQVLEANPGAVAEKLPAGMKISLPYIENLSANNGGIRLWS